MRRHPDFHHPLPNNNYGSIAATAIGMLLGIVVVGIFLGFVLAFFAAQASAHESWISNGGYKNSAGEWCCGTYDCKAYPQASSTSIGWFLDGELVPFDEAMPVPPPDGQVTVCRRPDGTRRCVFGVKPGL